MDIRNVTLKSLRRNIGIVQQDIFLFSDSVRENIAYGNPHASMEEIITAARLAEADALSISCRMVMTASLVNAVLNCPEAKNRGLPLPVFFSKSTHPDFRRSDFFPG